MLASVSALLGNRLAGLFCFVQSIDVGGFAQRFARVRGWILQGDCTRVCIGAWLWRRVWLRGARAWVLGFGGIFYTHRSMLLLSSPALDWVGID